LLISELFNVLLFHSLAGVFHPQVFEGKLLVTKPTHFPRRCSHRTFMLLMVRTPSTGMGL